jgi:hypothetical protein
LLHGEQEVAEPHRLGDANSRCSAASDQSPTPCTSVGAMAIGAPSSMLFERATKPGRAGSKPIAKVTWSAASAARDDLELGP